MTTLAATTQPASSADMSNIAANNRSNFILLLTISPRGPAMLDMQPAIFHPSVTG